MDNVYMIAEIAARCSAPGDWFLTSRRTRDALEVFKKDPNIISTYFICQTNSGGLLLRPIWGWLGPSWDYRRMTTATIFNHPLFLGLDQAGRKRLFDKWNEKTGMAYFGEACRRGYFYLVTPQQIITDKLRHPQRLQRTYLNKMLRFATNHDNIEFMHALLAAGATSSDDVDSDDSDDEDALECACSTRAVEVLLRAGAQATNRTLIEVCQKEGRLGAARALIDAGVDVHVRNVHGTTAIMCVKSKDVFDLLVCAGADVNARDCMGKTALMYYHSEEVMQALIDAGVDVNARDDRGRTALMHTMCSSSSTIQMIIRAGADVNAQDNDGRTALMHAVDSSKAQALIDAGVDVNAQDNDGRTALIWAVDKCHGDYEESKDLIRTIISAGADVNVQDNDGRTALIRVVDTCYYEESKDLIRMISSAGADQMRRLKKENELLRRQLIEVQEETRFYKGLYESVDNTCYEMMSHLSANVSTSRCVSLF